MAFDGLGLWMDLAMMVRIVALYAMQASFIADGLGSSGEC